MIVPNIYSAMADFTELLTQLEERGGTMHPDWEASARGHIEAAAQHIAAAKVAVQHHLDHLNHEDLKKKADAKAAK